MKFKTILLFALALCATSSFAVSKVRLIYGEKWQKAGRDVKKMMESKEWNFEARGRYTTEFINEEGDRAVPENRDSRGKPMSWKLPVAFVFDEHNRCYCVIENIPYNISAKKFVAKLKAVDKKREEIEKQFGTDTLDGCGRLMQAMEKYVGGPKRVIEPMFYGDVFEKLKKLDPEDKEGWQRHFTMDDGLLIVEKATEFRKDKKVAEGEKYIERELSLPRKHLTKEQMQGLLMAKFALYAPDDPKQWSPGQKRQELIDLLKKVAEFDERTLWGTAALGWLNLLGEPQLSVYWGWHNGDFPVGRFETKIKYGVDHAFPKAGDYTIEFVGKSGASLNVDSISLYCHGEGDEFEEVAKLTRAPFTFKLKRPYAGKLTHMIVRGNCGGQNSTGEIRIERNVLRPRKEAK